MGSAFMTTSSFTPTLQLCGSPTHLGPRDLDYGESSSASISSYDGSMAHVEVSPVMSRGHSNDGTVGSLGSWQFIPQTPSPRVAPSSPEQDRGMSYSPTYSNQDLYTSRQDIQQEIFMDDEDFLTQSSQPSSQNTQPTSWDNSTVSQSSIAFNFQATTAPVYLPPAYHGATTTGFIPSPDRMAWSSMAIDNNQFLGFMPGPLDNMAQAPSISTFQAGTTQPFTTGPALLTHMSFDSTAGYNTSGNGYLGNDLQRQRSSSGSSYVPMNTPDLLPVEMRHSTASTIRHVPHQSVEPLSISQSFITDTGATKREHSFSPIDSTIRAKPARAKRRIDGVFSHPGHEGSFGVLNYSNNLKVEHPKSGVTKKTIAKGRGGREKGTYKLTPQKAQEVRERREQGACWTCALQRDVCSQGEICNRCQKRIERGVLDSTDSLCCVREKLYDFMQYFIPHQMNAHNDERTVKQFAEAHIRGFTNQSITIKITPIWSFPGVECELFLFEPRDAELLTQRVFWLNRKTNKYEAKECQSPPVSVKRIGSNPEDQQIYENYFDMLAGSPDYMLKFAGDILFRDQVDPFLSRLTSMMVKYKPQKKAEVDFMRQVNKMLLASYCFGRTVMIPANQQKKLEQLTQQNYQMSFASNTMPKMANRQLKHIFLRIVNKTMDSVLRRLDRVYRSSKGNKEWIMAFYGVLGLAIVFEDMQNTACCFLHGESQNGRLTEWDAQQDLRQIIEAIDHKYTFVTRLFKMKYQKAFNPLKDWQQGSVRDVLGDEGTAFVSDVSRLVTEKWDYIDERQRIVPTFTNSEMYYGRLVSQFLNSFLRSL
ncbi:hypothetical protein BT63DRAFT_453660 [Microthyrium microscopicum]|uniref:Zn(2)-C6 fungal-type domain-containing protein n=1 Tax=Microthyrium microscopicum TaxID=703497 RepID=A0A6A6UHH5_9PEZI|nr:hypothetical protein BT63DRAFT_453660 [Microthyrium microscopicum]